MWFVHEIEAFMGEMCAIVANLIELELSFRLAWTMLLCGIVGLERAKHNRATGFRPHILVGIFSCLVTMAGAYSPLSERTGSDPLRIASYVVSGIGFLGAGAILRQGSSVRGITTAASLWGSAGIGISVGVGLGGLATAATLLVLLTLVVLEKLEAMMGDDNHRERIRLSLRDGLGSAAKALSALESLGVPLRRATLTSREPGSLALEVEIDGSLPREEIRAVLVEALALDGLIPAGTNPLGTEEGSSNSRSVGRSTPRADAGKPISA